VVDNAIEVEGLVKTFKGGVKALDGLSLVVETGTVFGLLGPNGAGKTTAVRVLTTVLIPDRGSARVLGHDVVAEPQTVRSIIGLAGQYAAVDENLTGRENLRLIGQLNHLSRSIASSRSDALLERFELTDAANRTAKTYSGGMRRRLDLAAALVAQPPVLLLDEPTTGLDPYSRVALWATIEGLVAEGTTVLLTTQYLEEADRLARKVAVVDRGKVIAEGTPADLKSSMGTTVLDLTMADESVARRAGELLAHLVEKPAVVSENVVELAIDDGAKMGVEALRLLDDAGIAPASLNLREPSLDDVFLSLTGHRAEDAKTPKDGAAP
jgi:ABC-2 type transport system ATP-binding protein